MNTRLVRRLHCSVLALVALAVLTPVAVAKDPMTPTEKTHVRALLRIAWDLFWEDCRGATFDSELNPTSQAGPQACYTRIATSSGSRPATVEDGYFEYLRMLRQNRLCKDPAISGGGSTTLANGLGADGVSISGPQLDSSRTNADPVRRARDKFQIIRTLMNEMAHVFQKPETGTATNRDLTRCDMERDSDCLSLKFYDMLINRLESSPGVPHTTLAGMRAEGAAGRRIADCLESAGVDTTAEIAGVRAWMVFHRTLLQDRKDGLFATQIGQSKSWRTLYYGGRYRSPLLLRSNTANVATTRQFTLTWIDGSNRTYTVPNDGKTVVRVIIRRNLDSCIYVRAVTQGSDGAVCIYTWTDTDKDGLPETGTRADHSVPAPPRQMRDVDFDGVYELEEVPQVLGFVNGFMIHDQVNGRLMAYETATNDIDMTGNWVELVSDPLYADPSLGDPLAQGFSHYVVDQIDPGLAQPVLLFCDEPHVGQFGDTQTLIVPIDPFGGFPPFGPLPLADAFGFDAPFGAEQLPFNADGEMVLHGPVFDNLILISDNLPQIAPPIGVFGTDQFGVSPPLPPFPIIESERVRILSQNSGQEIVHDVPRLGQDGNSVLVDPDGNGLDTELVLIDFPPALLWRDPAIPLGPNDVPVVAEFRLEQVDPLDPQIPGVAIELDPFGQPLVGFGNGDDRGLFWIPGTTPPLFGQSVHDFDGNGGDNDTLVFGRPNGVPQSQVWMFTDFDLGLPGQLPSFQLQLPIEPGGILYQDLDGDGDTDVLVEDFFGGPPLCLINNLDGTLTIGACAPPCPPDTNGDGFLDNGDIIAYINLFLSGDASADFNGDGILDNGDIGAFILAFIAGC